MPILRLYRFPAVAAPIIAIRAPTSLAFRCGSRPSSASESSVAYREADYFQQMIEDQFDTLYREGELRQEKSRPVRSADDKFARRPW